jgi:hypothetical protein
MIAMREDIINRVVVLVPNPAILFGKGAWPSQSRSGLLGFALGWNDPH